jgi:hypothetical protein
MNHSLTLEAVQKDFNHWRQNRKKRGSIPADLWQRVFPLLNRYPISKICSALSLNTAQIRSNMRSPNPFEESKSQEPFVEVSLKSVGMIESIGNVTIEIMRKDGTSMSICSCPSHSLNALIDHFLMG